MNRLVFDFELRSHVSVVDVGGQKYARHPSTQILCVSWCEKTCSGWGPVFIAIKEGGSDGRAAIERRLRERGCHVAAWAEFEAALTRASVLVSHNSEFEEAILEHKLPHLFRADAHWSCTASRARRLSLPGGLEGACNAMRTPNRKSAEGHVSMMQVSQPRPAWRINGSGSEYFDDADRLADCAHYCVLDTAAERDLDDVLPELSDLEYAVWCQIKRANRRGLRLDVELISAMEKMVEGNEETVMAELRVLTGDPNFSLTAPAVVRDFCAGRGVHLPDLRKETVEGFLASAMNRARPVDPVVLRVLEGRQSVGKSSNAKLPAMRDRLEEDGYARDFTIFFGAHTGRQTGSKINPLNMPRSWKGYNQASVLDLILRHDLRGIEKLRVTPATAVSASLRGVIIAPEGKVFAIGDYKAIEPCVLFTLAGQRDAVEILRNKGDIYCEMASSVYGRHITEENKQERQFGKLLILGLGYGMGADKFLLQIKREGLDVSEDFGRAAHGIYRTRFPKVKELWDGVGAAVKAAIRNPGRRFAYGVISYIFDGYWLVAMLPSGRGMFYPNAALMPGKYDDDITYDGRQMGGGWGTVRTWSGSLVENLCQAISRDITVEDKLELERRYGWHVPLDVYDEIVAEADEADPHAKEKLEAVMNRSRPWLPEVPVSAECFTAKRYEKR